MDHFNILEYRVSENSLSEKKEQACPIYRGFGGLSNNRINKLDERASRLIFK